MSRERLGALDMMPVQVSRPPPAERVKAIKDGYREENCQNNLPKRDGHNPNMPRKPRNRYGQSRTQTDPLPPISIGAGASAACSENKCFWNTGKRPPSVRLLS